MSVATVTSWRNRFPAAPRELSVESLGAGPDFARNRIPRASSGKAVPVPGHPGVEPFANRPKGEDLRPKARRLKLVRKVVSPGLRKHRIFLEKRPYRRAGDSAGARVYDRHAVAVVSLGEHGRFREHGLRHGALQDQPSPVRPVANEMRFAVEDEMQHRDVVAPAEDERTRVEPAFGPGELVEPIEQGHVPDSYHVGVLRVQT